MRSTEQVIFDIISRICSIPLERITARATLKELDVHSLDVVQIVFEIEDHFDISVPERDDRYAAGTLRELVEGVERLVAAKARAA